MKKGNYYTTLFENTVSAQGELGKQLSKMVGIGEHANHSVDTETLFVAKINGRHVETQRKFCPQDKRMKNERPETGKHYPALISFVAGQPYIFINARIDETAHDDGAEYANIIASKTIKIEGTVGQFHARTTPGFQLPELAL